MRKLDKTKKSNIKCEHCKHIITRCNVNTGEKNYLCALTMEQINYWNRCKDFDWKDKYKEDTKMLTLPIKKKWFDMILSGERKEKDLKCLI